MTVRQRVVLITGAGRGLGSALARHWGKKGTRLLLHANSSLEGLQETANIVKQQGAEVSLFQADLASCQAREALFHQVQQHCQYLSVLVNNAAVFSVTPLEQLTTQAFSRTMEINCMAVHHLTLLARELLSGGAPAQVVNIGDSAADRITARSNDAAYHISKLGVHILTRSFAKLLAPAGIRVNMVSPGMLQNSIKDPSQPQPSNPLGRTGSFQDIIAAVDYLCSPQAAYVNGSNLVVSGGWNL